jgi:putative addiction module component (TIGR02574 family)
MGINPSDLASLSVEEKLDLISNLWDSIEATAEMPPLSDIQNRELARRRAEGLRDPAATVDWATVQQELRKKP